MKDWLSTTQHKINAAIIIAVLVFVAVYAYRAYQHEEADKAVQAASVRAIRATVADSTKQVVLVPLIGKLQKEIDALKKADENQRIKNNLLSQQNENLYKQLDSVNAVLDVRPDF
jgi:predicted negative regulator of RcsB-dependent stress response